MDTVYDAIIVGGGPAGLSAAIYMARARFHVLVIEKEKMGGQITITSEVVNYPGIFHTSGEKLTSEMIRQAKAFGAEFLSADVTGLELEGDYKTVHTSRGDFKALGIIYAGGAHPRLAGFTGETEFQIWRSLLCYLRRRIFHRPHHLRHWRRLCSCGRGPLPYEVRKEDYHGYPGR